MSSNEGFRIGDTVQYKDEGNIYTIVDVYHDPTDPKTFYYTLASDKKIVKYAIDSNLKHVNIEIYQVYQPYRPQVQTIKHTALKRYQVHRTDVNGLEEVLNNINPENSFQVIPEACGDGTLFVVIEKYKKPKLIKE